MRRPQRGKHTQLPEAVDEPRSPGGGDHVREPQGGGHDAGDRERRGGVLEEEDEGEAGRGERESSDDAREEGGTDAGRSQDDTVGRSVGEELRGAGRRTVSGMTR
ncbi:MAG: hypothetical protein K0R81_3055 [Microbacterium sp.]|nr:hypothetical protein [Microbacterium sp.]